ncbi:TspO/MBR family protein [Catovirus CTV1]|uniref:TspO/MBR family protein n=1 Tax=Catovirus CTV1 TaxID=1977631 RepID=A0A1V0S976_9VIRU|nr:TspO/MBR family protein [Catovirus CTV1]
MIIEAIIIFIIIIAINFVLQRLFPSNESWYNSINRSPLTPPNYIFPIAWTILYLIISYSISQSINSPLFYFWMFNIALNIMWTPIFFHYNNSVLSAVVIGLMIASLLYILYNYYQTDKTLFYMNLLYLAWLCFAFYLNFYVAVSN